MNHKEIIEEAYQGVIGINEDLEIFGGYDGTIKTEIDVNKSGWLDDEADISNEELIKLADHMIQLWAKLKSEVGK